MEINHEYKDVSHFQFCADMKDKLSKPSEFSCVDEEQEQRIFGSGTPFVVMLQHDWPLSWVPEVPNMCDFTIKMQEKYEINLYPFVLYNRSIKKIPIVKELAEKFTGNSVSDYRHVVDVLKNVRGSFFGTAPEGTNCMFDFDKTVADFREFALIKAALATDTNIVMCTTKLSEPLGVSVRVPYIDSLRENAVGVKLPYFKPVSVRGLYEVFDKPCTPEEFLSLSKDQQKQMIRDVAGNIQQHMIDRHDTL